MIYIIPTKRGLGVQIWGTFDDLTTFYNVIGNFWNQEDFLNKKGFDNRDKLISGFSYEIRKAYEGSRLKRKNSHFSFEEIEHFGCQISWVHFLFSITALRYNMRFMESSKLDLSYFLQIEYWLEKSMLEYDEKGGNELKGFISDIIYAGNENIYQFMRTINLEYFLLSGGKKAFRMLPKLLQKSIYGTKEYKEYTEQLIKDAKKLKCETTELEISDENINYDISW